MTKIYSQRTSDFYKIYSSTVLPILSKYEINRKRTLAFINLEIIFAVFLYLWFPVSLLFGSNIAMSEMFVNIYILGFAVAIVMVINLTKQCKSFKHSVKEMCLSHAIKAFETLSWKDSADTIADIDLRNSLLFAEYTHRHTDDGFTGEYKGVGFTIAETKLFQQRNSGWNRCLVPIFKGVIIALKFNKTIKAQTVVTTKNDLYTANSLWLDILQVLLLVPYCFLWFCVDWQFRIVLMILLIVYVFIVVKKRLNQEKFELVKLEDPAFGKRFNVYSGDQVESRYLLTPSFMDRFYNLKTTYGAKGIKCSFFEDVLMVAIPTNKDLFEIGSVFTPLTDPKGIQDFYNELSSIYKLIDTFKLDEQTGL